MTKEQIDQAKLCGCKTGHDLHIFDMAYKLGFATGQLDALKEVQAYRDEINKEIEPEMAVNTIDDSINAAIAEQVDKNGGV